MINVTFEKYSISGRRVQNEDSSICISVKKMNTANLRYVFAVADGMGGMNAGDLASKIAINELKAFIDEKFYKHSPYNLFFKDNINKTCNELFNRLNKKIIETSKISNKYSGMGTTITIIFITDEKYIIMSLGDSRAYKITKNNVVLLTKDHTAIEEYLTKYPNARKSNIPAVYADALTRYLGNASKPEPFINVGHFSSGEIIILSTDGLHKWLDSSNIHRIISEETNLKSGIKRCVDRAYNNGSEDNISLIGIEFGKFSRVKKNLILNEQRAQLKTHKLHKDKMAKGKKFYVKTVLIISIVLIIGVLVWKYIPVQEKIVSLFERNPRFRFIKPGEGDTLIAGEYYNIIWKSGYLDTVNLSLTNNNDTIIIADSVSLKIGKYKWYVRNNNLGDSIKLMIDVVGRSDSNSFGYVESPFFSIVKNNREVYPGDNTKESLVQITLDHSTEIKELLNRLTKDNGSSQTVILSGKNLQAFLKVLKDVDSLRIKII